MSDDGMNSFLFSTPEMTRVFSPAEQLRAMTRFEWALSCALESNGRAEAGSGAVLEQLLNADFVDMDALVREAKDAGNIAIPFVRQLTAAVMARSEAAARSVHLGATSQDVLDTALVLQMREGLNLLEAALARLDAALLDQVKRHRDTVMQGRTWLQPGPPTTLGLKLAGTLAALRRDRERIRAEAEASACACSLAEPWALWLRWERRGVRSRRNWPGFSILLSQNCRGIRSGTAWLRWCRCSGF